MLESALVGGAAVDPTYRIGKLQAANKKVIVIAPNHSLEQAITLMLANDFSQLPVMQSDRDVKGGSQLGKHWNSTVFRAAM